MSSAIAVLYTNYPASGGQRLGQLLVERGTERTRLDGNETTELIVGVKRWSELGGDVRMVVQLIWPDSTISERRISKVSGSDIAATVQLELVPVFADLGTGGPIVRVVGGRVTTRVAGELRVSQALTTYALPHPASTRIGLAIGTMEKDVVVPFDLDAPTPAALIRELFDRAKMEMEMVRTSNTVWTLNGRAKRGSALAALQIRSARNQAKLLLGVDDQQLATVVVPLGDADPTTGDRATMATARWSVANIASGWVQLRDPADGAATPILVDTQWQNAYVVDRFGFAQTILNARISDGAVQLGSTTGLSVGSRVWIAADASGTPLVEIYDASSVGARLRAVPLPLSGMRGEANELRNGRFLDGLSEWTGANPTTPPAFAEITRPEFGVTLSGQANGLRAAATGTGTPFAIKGLPANSYVRQWAEIKVGGAIIQVSSDVIPDTSGAFTLPLSAGLPGSYPDDTPFTLIRREARTLTLDGEHSVLSTNLQFTDSNTDGIFAVNAGTINAASGGFKADIGNMEYVDAPLLAGRARMNPPSGYGQALNLGASGVTIDTAYISSFAPAAGATSATMRIMYTLATSIVVGTTRLSYYSANSRFVCVKVTANLGGGDYTVVPEGQPTLEMFSFTGYDAGVGGYAMRVSNGVMANASTWTATIVRETRTVRCNGAVSAAATSLPCKAQSNLLTRNWVATDTINMIRNLTATLDITAVGSVVPESYYDPDLDETFFTGYSHTVTFASGSSTLDDLSPSDLPSPLWIGNWRFVSIVGSTVNLFRLPADAGTNDPLTTGVVNLAWTLTDTYALSGTASWGTNGRVTLTLASAVPSGRSYARGLAVGSNWVSNALRLHEAVAATDTTVTLFGHDGFYSTSDPTSALRGAVYRIVATASTVPIPGNTLYAASTAQADGSGNASVTLTAANANAIANNEAVTIATPQMLRPADDRLGSVVRLTSPVGGSNIPISTTPGMMPITGIQIPVPAGTTVPVTVFATFSLSAGSYPLGQQPAVALVDGTGTVLATARLATGTAQVAQTPTFARIILQHTLTVATTLSVRLYGGSSDRTLLTLAIDAMLCVTDRDDVPFVLGSWSNPLTIRGAEELAARRDPAVSVQVDLATLRRWSDAPSGAPVAIGQSVVLPSIGITRRVLSIDRDVIEPDTVRVEIGVPTDELSTQVGIA